MQHIGAVIEERKVLKDAGASRETSAFWLHLRVSALYISCLISLLRHTLSHSNFLGRSRASVSHETKPHVWVIVLKRGKCSHLYLSGDLIFRLPSLNRPSLPLFIPRCLSTTSPCSFSCSPSFLSFAKRSHYASCSASPMRLRLRAERLCEPKGFCKAPCQTQ